MARRGCDNHILPRDKTETPLLPIPHFLLTFTFPAKPIRDFALNSKHEYNV